MKTHPHPKPMLVDLRSTTLLVIPVYNHRATLQKVVLRAIDTGFPVLVVDDGSTDGGTEVLAELSCHLHRLPENRGKGAAILAGAKLAAKWGYQAIVTLDANGWHDPGEIGLLVDMAASAGWPAVVIGSRRRVLTGATGRNPFHRGFSYFWVKLACGEELTDAQGTMRLYPVRELLHLKLSRTRYEFELEALVKLIWAGISVHEVEVDGHALPKEEQISHFHRFWDNWRLAGLHALLVFRRLLPLPNRRLVAREATSPGRIVVKNPWRTLKNLCSASNSPFWLAVAVWIGIFFGALPLLACHTVVIIYVAYRLHLNTIGAVAASQFCMPPVVPALCIEVGYFLRHGEFIVDLSWQRWLLEIHLRLLDWLLGSLLVGPLLGLLGAVIVYHVMTKMQAVRKHRTRVL